MPRFILTASGSDRPGLTRALAAAVLSAGGNWLESHLSRLGGLYVGSLLVELPAAGDVEGLRAAVRAVDAHGLEVRIVPAPEDPGEGASEVGETLGFSLMGQDRPGIVDQVTAVLGDEGANIESFRTWIDSASESGIPLFHADARLRLPPGVPAAQVQAALEAISAEIMVDISLTPAP